MRCLLFYYICNIKCLFVKILADYAMQAGI